VHKVQGCSLFIGGDCPYPPRQGEQPGRQRVARKKSETVTFGGDEWTFDRAQQHKRKLETLLKMAAVCFNDKGYSGTSLRSLASKLKVTDAALYYYVQSKQELVFLCYERALDVAGRATIQAAKEGVTGLQKLQLYIKYQIEAICGPDGPLAVLIELPLLTMAHRTHIVERLNKEVSLLAEFFEIGFKDGSMIKCNRRIASAAILGSLNWIAKWQHEKRNVAETVETYVQVLTGGLAAK
jgi:TetR/AcrR family transcriptional regulator, cholesterol catabolism regulator